MMSRKLLAAYSVGIAVFSVLSGMHLMFVQGSNGSFGGGNGTAADPYIIEDALDLQNMSSDLDAHYALSGDIDASATRTWNAGAGFMPVGRKNTPFIGSLDGRNNTITGLFIKRSAIEYVGLFGSIGASGSVKDVGLVQGDVTGNNYAGALAGANLGKVMGVRSTGRVSSTGYCVGGLVGYNDGGTVGGSHVTGNVAGGSSVGGLVGYSNVGTVNSSYTTGDVTGPGDCVGGLIGFNTGPVAYSHATGNVTGKELVGGLVGDNRNTISDCYATGKVSGSRCVGGLEGGSFGNITSSHATGAVVGRDYVGGLAGVAHATVSSSYATGNVTGTDDWIAGLVGQNQGTVKYSYSLGNVTGLGGVSGLVGWYSGNTVIESYYNIDEVHINGGHHITYRGLFDAQYQDWYSGGMDLRISDYSTTIVPSGDHYEICSDQGLRDLLGFGDVAEYKFTLSTDLDLSTDPGLYVPHLAGDFYGDNHTISNLDLELPFVNYLGMFGMKEGGTLRDLRLLDAHVDGYDFVGGLAGMNFNAAVSNTHSTGEITGHLYVGGFSGYSSEGSVSGNSAAGNVTASNYTGGFAGLLAGGLTDCHYTGNVTGIKHVGGLVGYSYGEPFGCHSDVVVKGTENVGGLVGYGMAMVSNSYSTGVVEGSTSIGGLVGYGYGTTSCSYATGRVSGDDAIGGLVGFVSYLGKVNNSYATGDVDGAYNVGGLVGNIYGQGTVDNSYAVGRVTGRSNAGGLVGASSGKVSNSFWDTEASGVSTSAGGVGRTTAEMMTRSTFTDAGWDFASVWFIVEDVTYPILRWQDEEPPRADAGSDQDVDEDTTVTFDGSGSSDDLGIVDSTWTLMDGTIVTLHGLGPSYTFDDPGIFVVTLNVTDAAGNWDTDDMTVTVNDVTAPAADAGPDQTVDEGALVTFDGSGSSDNGEITNYTWTFTDGVLITLNGANPTYLFDNPGTFIVTLNVTDAARNWDADEMTVTVNDTTPPIADAGPDQTGGEDTDFMLDGSGSSDNVGIVSWTWQIYYGVWTPDIVPILLSGEIVHFTFGVPGINDVRLHVKDAAGHTHSDNMTITVMDINPPRADAGPDQTIDEGTLLGFDGRYSFDCGEIVNYTWSFAYDGADIVLCGLQPSFTFDVPGIYLVELTVMDAVGHSDSDTMNVTVRDITPPVADAGPDRAIDEGTLVTLDGSGSTDNVGVVNYTWLISYDDEVVELYGVSVSFTSTVPDIYHAVLRVSDAAGLLGEDAMTLTVVDITPPVADAGPERTVPVDIAISLDGSFSVDNVGIVNYTWFFTYDGQARTLTGLAVQFTFEKGGVYAVVLTVADAVGNRGNDTVVITVVDMGRVTGTVLDEEGRPVKDAKVEITASDGKSYTTTTTANGSFALDVFHGDFTWRISKEGYKAISGSSSVVPMGGTELDLADQPLVKKGGEWPASTSLLTYVALGAILVMVLTALVMVPRRKRGRKRAA